MLAIRLPITIQNKYTHKPASLSSALFPPNFGFKSKYCELSIQEHEHYGKQTLYIAKMW